MATDLIIRNARLRSGIVRDIAISAGRVKQISESLNASTERVIDAKGKLTTETFVVPHLHLDKVMTGSLAEEGVLAAYHGASSSPMNAIEIASKVKEHYNEHEIVDRVNSVLSEAERFGVSHVRAFADVDTKAELVGIDALLKIKKEFKDRIALQIVAFPQDGIIRDPGTEELLYKAMDLGADVVGGIPWLEYAEKDSRKHVDIAFDIAKRYDADIAMLTDDAGDPALKTTEYLAESALKNGWVKHRVCACHARATALYNDQRHGALVALLKASDVGVVTDPHTGPLHVRVKELTEAGIAVALGQDDVFDAYYPYGRCNMLEVAFLASHLLWMMTNLDRELLYNMITHNAAKVMRVKNYGLIEGNPANLLVLDAGDLREALCYHSAPLYVIRRGVVLDR